MIARNHPKFGTRWDAEDDAVLIEHYANRGPCWCATKLPWRSVSAVRSRAHYLQCAPSKSMAAVLMRARRDADPGYSKNSRWTPPEPRYASIWAFAQGVRYEKA